MSPSSQSSFNFADLLGLVAATVPDRTAVVCGDSRLSFAQLSNRVEKLAGYLARAGLTPGETLAIHCRNRPEYLIAFFAACRLGVLPFNVNYRYVEEELEYLYGNARPAAALVEGEWLARVSALKNRPRLLVVTGDRANGGEGAASGVVEMEAALNAMSTAEAPPSARESRGEDALIIYTGGTTGMPKGVVWRQVDLLMASLGGGGFFSRHGAINQPIELIDRVCESPHLVMFPVAPLMHGAALWAALASLFAGHTLVLQVTRSFDPADVFSLCEQEGVNMLVIVGDGMGRPLADVLHAQPGRWALSALRYIGSGGAVFSEGVQESLRSALPSVVTASSLGSTESGTLGPGASRPIGEGLMCFAPRKDIHVVVDGSRMARVGEVGILARSGPLPVGYFGDPAATARTFIELDGMRLSLTGDSARLESDGSVTVLGRGSTCINTGGEKVFPEEVEQALKRHPGVVDALVIGLPDERWGERVVAVVSARADMSLDAEVLKQHCRQLVAGYKVPRVVAFVAEVPRTNTGKPDYSTAKKLATAQLS